MTGEVVNLRRARKTRDRTERQAAAAANRIAFGRTKAERQTQAVETARRVRVLDGHRLTRDGDES